jgi:hypothetical protein
MKITKIHPRLTSVKFGLILALCFTTTQTLFAQSLDVSRTTVTRIADLLNRFPAENSTAYNNAMKQMADFEEEALTQMALMFSENGDNEKLEYALSGFAFNVSQDENSEQAKKAVHAYGKALGEVNYDEAKAFLIESLRIMGNNEAVDYLAPYLSSERLASPAARALASIATPNAEKALLAALEQEDAEAVLLPLIEALGDIKSQAAASFIEPYVLSGNEAVKKVSIYSLARIGAPSSAKILAAAAQAADFQYENSNAASEYLNYIKNLADNGETKNALKLANKLHKSANNEGQFHTKAGALSLLASLDEAKSAKLLQKAALSPNAAYRNTAMDLAQKDMSADIQTWAKILRKSDDAVKVHLIRRLGELEGDAVLAVVKPYFQHDNPEVKIQAITTGVLLGENEILADLLAMVNTSSDEELQAIKGALLTMDGNDVSSEVAEVLPNASDEGKIVLMGVLAARPSAQHMEVVLAEVNSNNTEVKKAALATLHRLAAPSHLDQLVALLKSQQNPDELKEIQKAIIAANSQQQRAQQTDWALKTLQSLDKNKQIYLYDALANTGGTKALNSLNEIYQKGDSNQKKAALVALASWADAEAMDVLFAIAENDSNQENADKALEGYINLIKTTPAQNEGKVLMLRKALEVAKSNTNKQLVLRQLGQYPTFQALLVAGSHLDDAAVQQQAARAVMAIALADPSIYGEDVRAIVQKTQEVISGQDSEYYKTSLQKHLDEMPKDEGFSALFNGKNLDGWKGLVANPIKRQSMSAAQLKREQEKADEEMRSGWKVEDGLLVFTGKGNNLATEKNYGDFEMLVDWKITEKGDAGIYLRGTPQVQIWDTALVEVGAEVGSGGLYNNENHPSKPIKVADNPVGEWNTFYIKMVGDRVTVELNGELVVDNVVLENYWDKSLPIFPEEQIELQAHGTYVAYRDIYIRELPQSKRFELSEEEKKEGFEVLFDGDNLDKWVGNKTDYVIENGEIVIYPDRGGKGNLFTEKEYGDFVFRFEFKLTPGANNGLGIRAPLLGDAAYAGMELQILDNTADIYKNLEQYQYHGSLYGIAPAKKGFLKPVGEWNYQEVRVKGDDIQVILNGTEILNVNIAEAKEKGALDKREHSGLHRTKGHIGFLGHGDVVYFRNVRVKDLNK